MNINNNNNSLTTWEKTHRDELQNVWSHKLIFTIREDVSARAITPFPLCAPADHTLVIQMLPPQVQLFLHEIPHSMGQADRESLG